MKHVYYYRNRPPGLFVQPDGFNPDTRETWMPRQDADTPMGQRAFLGKVEYPEALPPEEVYRFELWPADPIEWAKFQVYEELRNDVPGDDSIWVYLDHADYIKKNPDDPGWAEDHTAIVTNILIVGNVDIEALPGEW